MQSKFSKLIADFFEDEEGLKDEKLLKETRSEKEESITLLNLYFVLLHLFQLIK